MKTLFTTPARGFAAVAGVVYLLVGVAGFALTGLHDFAGPSHATLVIFAVTPLHNTIHLAIGTAWVVAAARGDRAAKAVDLVNGGVLGLVTVLGLFTSALGMLGMHSLGDPDNFLHLATSTLSLYFGSAGAAAAKREDLLATRG
jgi:hypothetical protein